MVTRLFAAILASAPVWERLSPLDRARLGMALLAFVLLFVGVIAFVMVAARLAKREIRKPLPPVRDLTDAWARKPLVSPNPEADVASADETDRT